MLCAAYKHLLCPRGVAFTTLSTPCTPNELLPIAASWRSDEGALTVYYGPGLAGPGSPPSVARYDVSLAWHAWVAAVASLEFLCWVPADERLSPGRSSSLTRAGPRR